MAEHHICPVWVGYLLASPVRKLFENPGKILGPYVRVGPNGKVVCVDMQERMIRSLKKRAQKAGLSGRIETLICNEDSLGLDVLEEKIDFALACAVVHEVPDVAGFFTEIHKAMKPAGRLLVAEPKGHVSEQDFETTVSVAEQNGFTVTDTPQIKRRRAVLLQKKP